MPVDKRLEELIGEISKLEKLQSTTKCISCDRRKINKISILSVLKRNKFILGILGGFWIYTVFPLPFLQMFGIKIDPTSLPPIFITTAVMTIPFLFMLIAWQKRSPTINQTTFDDEQR
jgi:hypothetical protein